MFKGTKSKLKSFIDSIRQAFALFITTVEKLTLAIEVNTIKVISLEAEQKVLRHKFDLLVEHTHYLARAKRNELERSGHRVE